MFSDEGGVGTVSSCSTRRSRVRRAGGTWAGVFLVRCWLARGFPVRGFAERGFPVRDDDARRRPREREGFALTRLTAGARRFPFGRLPDLLDRADFVLLAAAFGREGRFRDFFLAIAALLPGNLDSVAISVVRSAAYRNPACLDMYGPEGLARRVSADRHIGAAGPSDPIPVINRPSRSGAASTPGPTHDDDGRQGDL